MDAISQFDDDSVSVLANSPDPWDPSAALLPSAIDPAVDPAAMNRAMTNLARYAEVDARARQDSTAQSTRAAYAHHWDQFEDWCIEHRLCPCPATGPTVRAYVASLHDDQQRSMSTIGQALSAIWARHDTEGRQAPARTDPALRQALQGYARQDRDRVIRQMAALLTSDAKRIMSSMNETLAQAVTDADDDDRKQLACRLIDARDRAVILFGMDTAYRRSELVRLDVDDLAEDERGLEVTARWTKADQAGRNRKTRAVARGTDITLCPVRAMNRWTNLAEIRSGPVFRAVSQWGKVSPAAMTPQVVRTIVKVRAEAAEIPGSWGAHSLRAGFATQASLNKAPLTTVKDHGGWTSDAVFAYFRKAEIWTDPASDFLGF